MRKNITIILVVSLLLTVVVGGISINKKIESSNDVSIKTEINNKSTVKTATKKKSDRENRKLKKKIHALESQLAASQEATQPTTATNSVIPQPESPFANFKKMLKSSGMKDMIKAQQRSEISNSFRPLLKYLDLTPEDSDALEDLLFDKKIALMRIRFSMMNSELSADEKAANAKRADALTAKYDDEIQELLGDENYGIYEDFESTQQERRSIGFFKKSLSAANHLSNDQEHNLIIAMQEERENFTFSSSPIDQNQFDPSGFTEEKMDVYMDETIQLQDKYIDRAIDILSDEQLEQFEGSLEQQRARQEMGIKMAVKMFGNSQNNTQK